GLVERAHAHEADRVAGARVAAPDRDAALRAARDHLALAALGWREHDFRLFGERDDPIGLDQRIERERGAALALAPAAVAAVDEQRRALEAIADRPAGAAAFDRERSGRRHGSPLLQEDRDGVPIPALCALERIVPRR